MPRIVQHRTRKEQAVEPDSSNTKRRNLIIVGHLIKAESVKIRNADLSTDALTVDSADHALPNCPKLKEK